MKKEINLDSFSGRLTAALEAIGKQKDVAKALDISIPTIIRYENGESTPDSKVLSKLITLFKINIHWLLTREEDMFLRARQSMDSSNFQLVPVIGAAACGSSGRIMEEDIEGYKAFEINFIRKFKKPVLTRAKGDSMLPVIADGDLLLCDRDENKRMRPDPMRMYLVNKSDEADKVQIKVKKISFSGHTLTLIPLNPAYPPTTMDVHGKSILDIVLGQIVWIGRELE